MAVIWLNWVEGRANEQRGDGQGGRRGGAKVQSRDWRCPNDGGGSFYDFLSLRGSELGKKSYKVECEA